MEQAAATHPHQLPDAHRAAAEAALEVLLDSALDPIVDMVCTARDGAYEALAHDGRVTFRRSGIDGSYERIAVSGRDPLADQSTAKFAPLADERANPFPKRAHNAYPHAFDQIAQLFVKSLFTGEATGTVLSDRLKLPYALLEALVEHVRVERLIEVKGTTGSGTASYRYALTDLGRERAHQYLDANSYVGPAPVPLNVYVETMRAVQDARGYIQRDRLARGFSHLVISEELLDQLGPAVNAGKAVFLYGPPGNGKTVIANGMGQTLGGDLYVPYAIDIEGETMTLYDPICHESLDTDEAASLVKPAPRDRRWVHCKRPVVMVGGELTLEQLDLTFNKIAKFHEAPIHLKANGGVFLVDDFGRQRIRPQELLNRWIVPLESRIDYLTLHNGKKFQVPFDVLIVFATNLDPRSLADEAFLRRIPYKIPVVDPTLEQFTDLVSYLESLKTNPQEK